MIPGSVDTVDDALDPHAGPTPPEPTTITAEALGRSLARSVVARTSRPGEGVAALAARFSVDPSRVTRELGYLSVVTTRFCVETVLCGEASRGRLVEAFYAELWSNASWGPHASGLSRRVTDYEDAFNHPHPELGRAYRLGRIFARWCRARNDVAFLELGARAYLEQLALTLAHLRGTQVV